MGILFALIFSFIILLILGSIIAGITVSIIVVLSNEEKRKKRIEFGIIAPFVILTSLVIVFLPGSIIISSVKNVDVGIGDTWYIPLNNSCQMLMINIPNDAVIECDGITIADNVIKLEANDNFIYGFNSQKKYFVLNLNNNELIYFNSKNNLLKNQNITKLNLVKVYEFYSEKKWEIAKMYYWIMIILALIITTVSLFMIHKKVFKNVRSNSQQKNNKHIK